MAYELTKKLGKIDTYIPPETSCRIKLDANEMPFDMSKEFPEEIAAAVSECAFNRYPDPLARKLTAAFADYYGLDTDMCTVGNGSDELISVILGAFLQKGDTVLTISPDFSMYAFYSMMWELKVDTMPKEDDLKINISKVIEHCNNNPVKAVIFSNPCNPTSIGVRRQDILRLVKNVFCLCIIDEAYMDLWDESILGDVKDHDNLIVLRTASKNMGMAGLRIGFAVSSPKITEMLHAVKSPYNISAIDQALGTVLLGHKDLIVRRTAEVRENREKLYEALAELVSHYFVLEKVFRSQTNFILVRTQRSALITEKLAERDIAVRSIGNYIRVTVGTEEENEAFLRELEDIVSVL